MRYHSSFPAFAIALFAILSLAAIPPGMMPHWGEDGFAIIICHNGQSQQHADGHEHHAEPMQHDEMSHHAAHGDPPSDHSQESLNESCAFAGMVAGHALLPSAVTVPSPFLHNAKTELIALALPVARTLHLPPSTGPPTVLNS